MSRVFVARDNRLGRDVVIKVLPIDMMAGISAERFEREIRVAARLQHPHIVPLLSAGESAGLLYYIMPFVAGESLRTRLARGPVPMGEAISVLRDVAKALGYAHEHGVVHRDIKPDNVLVSRGTAVVTDFGIAKAMSAARDDATRTRHETLTSIGTAIGTPAYMAPEQSAADPSADHRVDLYAFGCLAYELLTGRPPFVASSAQRLLAAQLTEPPVDVRTLRPDTPARIAELIMRCLEKEAAARPQSADDLVATLDAIAPTSAEQDAMPRLLLRGPERTWRALGLYAVSVIAVTLVAKAAIVAIGLPDWVFTGALLVMALGLPVMIFTAYVHFTTHRVLTSTPALTPGGTVAPHGTMATLALKASPHVTWTRAMRGGWLALVTFTLIVAGYMALRALGIGPAGSLLAAGRISERDRVVVTDFNVHGADSSLGTALAEAVRTDLGQSNVVSVLTTANVVAALRRMQRPPNTRIDLQIGKEMALRERAKAVVDGEITPVAGTYLLSLRLVSADSGLELAAFRGTADNATQLLPTLGQLSKQLRGKLGESLKKVQAAPRLAQVTTSSLDALRKEVESNRANNVEGDYPKAARLAREAIALDSTFAMAYRSLGVAARNAHMPRAMSDEATTKAYVYRDHLTERERYLAIADYFAGPGNDRSRSIAAYEDLLADHPYDAAAIHNLGVRYSRRREFVPAESLFKRVLSMDTTIAATYGALSEGLISQGKLDSAASVLAAARARFGDHATLESVVPQLAYALGSLDSTEAAYSAMRKSRAASNRVAALTGLAQLAELQGKLGKSSKLFSEAAVENAARGAPGSPLDDSLAAARVDARFLGQPARAAARLDALVQRITLRSLAVEDRQYFQIASTYALAGRPDRARAILGEFNAAVRDSLVRAGYEPARHQALAEILLAERRPNEAVAEFRAADRLPDGPVDGCAPCVYAGVGRAFDMAGATDSAIVAYEQFLSTHFVDRLAVDAENRALVEERLGLLYEKRGDRERANAHLARFVDLWKNADPQLQPRLQDIRRRLPR